MSFATQWHVTDSGSACRRPSRLCCFNGVYTVCVIAWICWQCRCFFDDEWATLKLLYSCTVVDTCCMLLILVVTVFTHAGLNCFIYVINYSITCHFCLWCLICVPWSLAVSCDAISLSLSRRGQRILPVMCFTHS